MPTSIRKVDLRCRQLGFRAQPHEHLFISPDLELLRDGLEALKTDALAELPRRGCAKEKVLRTFTDLYTKLEASLMAASVDLRAHVGTSAYQRSVPVRPRFLE